MNSDPTYLNSVTFYEFLYFQIWFFVPFGGLKRECSVIYLFQFIFSCHLWRITQCLAAIKSDLCADKITFSTCKWFKISFTIFSLVWCQHTSLHCAAKHYTQLIQAKCFAYVIPCISMYLIQNCHCITYFTHFYWQ